MFRTWLQAILPGWLKGKSRSAKQGCKAGYRFKPTVEALENRIVPSFSAASSISVGSAPDIFIPNAAPESVATADLNGATLNGKPILDLIEVHNYDANDGYVDVLMGKGDGTFKPAIKYPTTAYLCGDVLLGDFTNNGKMSLILPYLNSSLTEAGYVEMLGNGDGTFQAPIYSAPNVFNPFGSSTYARGWAVGDFNGDGNLDLIANDVGVGVTVLLGNGNGTFQAPIATPVSMGYSRWIAVGDFTGNGLDDVAIADGMGANNQESPGPGAGGSELTILLSNGNGTFGPAVHYAPPPTPDPGGDGLGGGDTLNPEDVTVAALVAGGPLDVIESLYDHSIDVFMGNGNGTFQPAVGYTTGQYPRDVQVADLTGNGIPDLIVDNVGVGPGGAASFAEGSEDGSIAVLMGNGDGTFQVPIQYSSVYYPGSVAVGDFNNDGLPDFAVTGVFNSSTINIMLNEPAADPVTLASPASATGVLPNQPASIFANSPTGMTTVLSALGADSTTAETNLTYTWSVLSKPSGAANPTFSINDSNAAQNTTATFSGFGLFTFEVTITDPLGDSVASTVQVYAVQNKPPTIGSAPIVVAPSPVSGTSTTLEIPMGSNIGGAESDNGYLNLIYTWQTVGTPPSPVTFTQVGLPLTETGFVYPVGNSLSCDYETTATVTKAGNYSFRVTITDPEGDSITSSDVNVTVNQTLTSIVVTPPSVNVADGGTQQFSAIALDQFGNPLATQPTFTWTSTGPGSVNSSGLYSAPSSGTGSATVKAKSGSGSGTASVTVTAGQSRPTVTGIAPAVGPITGGTSVVLTGTNFSGATAVDFGSVPTLSFTVNSATRITVTTRAESASTFDITVTTAGGTSATSGADQFTYQAANLDTWTGLGATNNWSDASNWSKDAAPGSGDTVVFDGHSGKNAMVDAGFAGSVAAVQISGGYSGTISLSRNLTVTGTFTEQAGTYNDGNFTTNVTGLSAVSGGTFQASTTADALTGGLTVSGGTFAGSTGTVTTSKVMLSSGTLNAPSGTLDVTGGNFTYTGGIFNADEGTVAYSGSGTPTVSATGLRFYNFQDSLTPYPSSLTISGTLTATGTFSIVGNSLTVNGNIEAQGNVDDENHGGIGSPVLTLDGNANQAIEDLSGVGGGQFQTITINKTGGTVSLACNPAVYTGLTLTAGTVNTGTFAWFLGSSSPVSTAPGTNLGNIEINGSVTVSSASLQVANVTFAAAGDSLKAPTGILFVSGNWNNSVGGTFTPNGGAVVFNGSESTQQLTSGGQAFDNLAIAAGATVTVTAGQSRPTVTGIAPAVGPITGGTSVVLTGTNFSGATAVDFGSVAARSFTVNSATQITVTTPAESASTVDVTVTTAVGTSSASFADQFIYARTIVAVTSNSDSGPGSLRQAILDANGTPGTADTVQFQLPAGAQTISLQSALPTATGPLTFVLDATQKVTIGLSPGTVWNDNDLLNQTGAGSLTFSGGIEGTGNLSVNAGSDLTANHIVQGALVIGGTAGSPAMVTIAASDASGNPLALPAGAATDSTMSSPQLVAPPVARPSAITATSTASAITAETNASPTWTRAIADPSGNAGSLGSALAAKTRLSDSASLNAFQSSGEIFGAASLPNSASHDTDRLSSTPNRATARDEQPTATANGIGNLLHPDAVAATFDDADILEWVASIPASMPSAADADITLMADDLLEAIGQQWRN